MIDAYQCLGYLFMAWLVGILTGMLIQSRRRAHEPPDLRAQIQALLARIDEWCGSEHDAEPIEFICEEIRPKLLALLDAQEPQR